MQFVDFASVSSLTETDKGLWGVAKVARTGIQTYSGAELGIVDVERVRVFRPLEEVMSVESLESYTNAPVTDDHPADGVTPDTWKEKARGTVHSVAKDGEWVVAKVSIADRALIDRVKAGKHEVSMGYHAEIDLTPGTTPDGQQYDAVQRSIRINHLAVVDRGRANVHDAAAGSTWGAAPIITTDRKDVGTMADAIKTRSVLIDGLSVETTDAGAQALEKLQSTIADKDKALDDAQAAHDAALATKDAEIAAKDAEIADLKGKVLTDADLDSRVTARADLVDRARKIAPKVETKGLSDDAIKRAAVEAVRGSMDGQSEAYIAAAFDLACEAKADPLADAAKGVKPQNDALPSDTAYAASIKELGDAWKAGPKVKEA